MENWAEYLEKKLGDDFEELTAVQIKPAITRVTGLYPI